MFAYVFLVMKDEKYALGAMACAYSLKLTGTKYHIVCMITPDISTEMRGYLIQVFDKVVEVPYIQTCTSSLRTNKQNSMYANWKDISFTKWNCLSLVEYEKILFVDADKIILQSLDHLFQLNTPAGTFSSPHSEFFLEKGGIKDPYISMKHGDKLDPRMIEFGLFGSKNTSSFTVIGTSILLSPDIQHYNYLIQMISEYDKNTPFGLKCYSMTDEQCIVFFYHKYLPRITSKEYRWSYISQKYNWISWRYTWLREKETPPSVIHYFGIKPWILKRNEWLDLEVWWIFVSSMLKNTFNLDYSKLGITKHTPKEFSKPEGPMSAELFSKPAGKDEEKEGKEETPTNNNNLLKLYRIDQLEYPEQKGCFYCKIAQKNNDHQFIELIDGIPRIVCCLYTAQLSETLTK